MINLLKADLFRLRKSKTFKISMLIMLVLVFGFVFLYLDAEGFLNINATYRDGRMYGFSIGNIKDNREYINYFRSSLGFMIFICLTMLFIVTDFVISKYSKGILKNVVSYGHSKYKVYISNLISIYTGISVIAILYVTLSMIITTILFPIGSGISKGEIIIILKVMLTVLIILAAMVSFYTLICTIIRSKAVVTTVGALFMTLVSAMLFDVISIPMKNNIPIYMLTDICGQPTDLPLINTFIVNSIVIVVISTILGCIIFNKQEIK